MRLSAALLAASLTAGAAAAAQPLAVSVHRIDDFGILRPAQTEGPLEFLGGLDVTSRDPAFGGFSGIDVDEAGSQAFLVGDTGSFVRARLVYEGGRLGGLADATIGPLFPDGEPSKQSGDAEDVAFDPADRRRGVIVRERQANAMLTFEMENGSPANFKARTVGAENRLLRSNKGLESVAFAPPGSPVAGSIVAIAERPPRGEAAIPGWVAGVGAFRIVAHDGFDVSSARFMQNGDLLLLERRYTPGWGIAVRLRRIAGNAVKVGALLDGGYLLDVGMGHQIDNMEGLAVHRDRAGRTVLTLVSDDNHSILQRTLILQFALLED